MATPAWFVQANPHFISAKVPLGGFEGDAEILLLAGRRAGATNAAGASLRWEVGQCCLLVEPWLCSGTDRNWYQLQGSVHIVSHRNRGCECPLQHPFASK